MKEKEDKKLTNQIINEILNWAKAASPRCEVCALDPNLLAAVNNIYGRIKQTELRRFLKNSRNITISKFKLAQHFQAGHHLSPEEENNKE